MFLLLWADDVLREMVRHFRVTVDWCNNRWWQFLYFHLITLASSLCFLYSSQVSYSTWICWCMNTKQPPTTIVPKSNNLPLNIPECKHWLPWPYCTYHNRSHMAKNVRDQTSLTQVGDWEKKHIHNYWKKEKVVQRSVNTMSVYRGYATTSCRNIALQIGGFIPIKVFLITGFSSANGYVVILGSSSLDLMKKKNVMIHCST